MGPEALLARVLLEGVGAAARSLGRALREPGTLLGLVLLPVLEHYGVEPHRSTVFIDAIHLFRLLPLHINTVDCG